MKIVKKLILIGIIIAFVIVSVKNFKSTDSLDEETETTATSESEVIKTDIVNTISNSSSVSTALEETKELHTTYYFNQVLVEQNQQILEGQNIVEYTNGTYMTAPYNCVITDWSLPESGEMCTSSHSITIQSTDTLQMTLTVDEEDLSKVALGQEAVIDIDVLENNIAGYVTDISNSGTYSSSGSTFEITVEFQNDGNVMFGMSAKCSIVLEKAEDVVAVATEAIIEQNGKKYVTVQNENGKTMETEVETGISNDAYTEIKSGLTEGQIVLIEKQEDTNSKNRMNGRMNQGGNGGENQGFDMQDRNSGPPSQEEMSRER